MSDSSTSLSRNAYDYLRDEIAREDKNTHDRLISALTFHGFLIASMTFVLSNQWTFDGTGMSGPVGFFVNVATLRVAVLFGIGIAGLLVGVCTILGIHASRSSIKATIAWWEKPEHNDFRKSINPPPAFGEGWRHVFGGVSVLGIAYVLPIGWAAYLATICHIGIGR
jgi:hypothetical protein